MNVLALFNIKGGVGKTSTAVNLAFLAAQDGLRTLLWDLDPQGASTYTYRIRARIRSREGDFLHDVDGLEASIKASDYEGLDLLPADRVYRQLDRILDGTADPERTFAKILRRFEKHYDLVLFDCAPNLSLTAECLFACSDALVVPTVPTVLSLRTLAQLMKHTKGLRKRGLEVYPFFSMVDARKSLHRNIVAYAAQERLGFLETSVPYASAVEQMTVRRSPLVQFLPASPAAKAFGQLWTEIRERLQGRATRGPKRSRIRTLLAEVEGKGSVPLSPTNGHMVEELEFKLLVRNEADFEALARTLRGEQGASLPAPDRQVNHFFDSQKRGLSGAGYALRLREEASGAKLTLKGPALRSENGLTSRPECEIAVSPSQAEAILGGAISPLDVLERSRPDDPSVHVARRAVGQEPLRLLGHFVNERRKLGPCPLDNGSQVTFELDRTSFPGELIEYEVELEVESQDVGQARRHLESLFQRAGLPWVPATSKAGRFFERLQLARPDA